MKPRSKNENDTSKKVDAKEKDDGRLMSQIAAAADTLMTFMGRREGDGRTSRGVS